MRIQEFKAWFAGFVGGKDSLDAAHLKLLCDEVQKLTIDGHAKVYHSVVVHPGEGSSSAIAHHRVICAGGGGSGGSGPTLGTNGQM